MSSAQTRVAIIAGNLGESVVILTPANKTIVIDNYEAESNGRVINYALEYLERRCHGAAVELVCLTHAHYDHYKGMLALLKRRTPSRFATNFAVHPLLLLRYLKLIAAATREERLTRSLKELYGIFEFVSRKTIDKRSLAESNLLYSEPENDLYLISVAPSTASVNKYNGALYRVFKAEKASIRANIDDNEVSGGVLLRFGVGNSYFLGDCLKRSLRDMVGREDEAPFGVSGTLIKVPHHGSESSYSREFWRTFCNDDTRAVVCPYCQQSLPDSDVVAKIGDHAQCEVIEADSSVDLTEVHETLLGISDEWFSNKRGSGNLISCREFHLNREGFITDYGSVEL